MSIITAESYSLSFGHLADVIPPSSVFALLSDSENKQLGAAWYKLAELHGVTAALRRLMPEDKYAGTHEQGGYHLSRKVGSLTLSRHVPANPDEEPRFSVHGLQQGDTSLLLLSSHAPLITGGPWLRELEASAGKAPFNRFEAGAASFHKWLRAQP